MSFFKKWKNYSKHKKLSEEWTLATSLKDLSEQHDEDDDTTGERLKIETFDLKYLGNTRIFSSRSQVATADAIKSIITTAKATNKKLQRIKLNVSPKGIEILDYVTGERILQISIYKISYCSSDAQNRDVFAFVSSDTEQIVTSDKVEKLSTDEMLNCYAFLCSKRKIAQQVTLTVARNFEAAYQIWHDMTQRRKYQLERMARQENKQQKIDVDHNDRSNELEHHTSKHILIDLNSELITDLCHTDNRDFLQNTWISFDDEEKKLNFNKQRNNYQQSICS